MKKFIYASVILILLITIYLSVNFLFFDKWTLHQSEKQINNYIENHENKKLKKISQDDKTYKFLKESKNLSVVGKSDNQGSGSVNYYRVNINDSSAELYIKSNHAFIPEKTTIQH
ncbi:hypothetical protein, partial [Staphylococcus succinus]